MSIIPTDKNQMLPTSSPFISVDERTRLYNLFSTLKVISIRAKNIKELAERIENRRPKFCSVKSPIAPKRAHIAAHISATGKAF